MSNNVIQHLDPNTKTTQSLVLPTLTNPVLHLRLATMPPVIGGNADQIVAHYHSKQVSLELGEYLQQQPDEIKLDQMLASNPTCGFQNQTNSLRIRCSQEIMVVYPDRFWYRQANPSLIE
jgi:hypothetical protein